MRKWQRFWEEFPRKAQETEFLKQVGSTVGGEPISDSQFRQIVVEVSDRLEISNDDVVLDLCCGNGLITNEIARASRFVVGVDYSRALITIARKYHNPRNVCYICSSVLDLVPGNLEVFAPFTKVYMYGALQYFEREDLKRIVELILEVTTKDGVILFGAVPDRARMWNFYNSLKRRLSYVGRKLRGCEAIGTWWKRDYIRRVCNRLELDCEFFDHHETLHTSHYRFDLRITRPTRAEVAQ